MTATCTLCGTILSVEPDTILDDQRDDRTLGRLGARFRKHIDTHHLGDKQTAIDIPATLGQVFGVMAITSQSALLLSYLQCEDPVFLKKTTQVREILSKAIEPKELVPQVKL